MSRHQHAEFRLVAHSQVNYECAVGVRKQVMSPIGEASGDQQARAGATHQSPSVNHQVIGVRLCACVCVQSHSRI